MFQENEPVSKAHQALNLVIRSSRLHHRGIEKLFGDTGLHRSQRMMLMFLSRKESIPSQREIADHFNISPACVARALKSMASEGYIIRTCDQDDQRRNHVSITEKGLQLITETRNSFEEFDKTAFVGFSEEEHDQLIALLSRMHENLQASVESVPEVPDNAQ